MRFRPTEHFTECYKNLPVHIQVQVDKRLSLLLENPKHPSLRIKKVQGIREGIFEGRITMSWNYRFTFQIEGDTHILRKVGPHNQALKKPQFFMNRKNIYRVIDANLNRAREGIRVTEEVARLYFNDAELSSQLKSLRHQLTESRQK